MRIAVKVLHLPPDEVDERASVSKPVQAMHASTCSGQRALGLGVPLDGAGTTEDAQTRAISESASCGARLLELDDDSALDRDLDMVLFVIEMG